MGGLFFSRELDDSLVDETHNLEWMRQFSQWLIDNSNNFPERMELGSSAGGAKPKCLIQIDKIEWIAKFQPGNEPLNKPAIEHGTLKLAEACGIPVPNSRLIDLPDNRQALLVKRFDRDQKKPLHYMSGQTLCGVLFNDAGQVINDTRSYLIIADALSKMSAEPQADRVDLFRRIIFNILVNNHDDHAKNHGVVRSLKGQWRLSKAFDLVAGEGGSRDLAMVLGPEGSKATFGNLLQSVDSFGLSSREAIDEIITMVENIQNWKQLFEDSGVSKNTINEITWAIQESIDVSGL
jgi:serine/threonine-protein kinase HipA